MEKPLVSIVIPCYNYEGFVLEALQSVREQSYANWECIVVNDGSTDNSLQKINTYISNDSRFVVISQANSGLSAARNKGLLNAKGKYIQFLDADDWIASDKLALQVEQLEQQESTCIAYSDFLLSDEQRLNTWPRIPGRVILKSNALLDFICNWEKDLSIPIHCYLFPKQSFDLWGGFDLSLPTHEDLDINIKFSLKGNRYIQAGGQLCFYRMHQASMTKDRTNMHLGYFFVLKKYIYNKEVSFINKLYLLNRYFEVIVNTFIDAFLYKRACFLRIISSKGLMVYNLFGMVLFPIYFLIKLIKKVLGK